MEPKRHLWSAGALLSLSPREHRDQTKVLTVWLTAQKRRPSPALQIKTPHVSGASVESQTEFVFRLRRRGFALRCTCRRIHKILQFLAGLEKRNLLRRHIHLLPSLRIPPDAAAALPGAKAAEPANFDFVALLQRVNDALENRFHDRFRFFARKLRHPEHFLD